MNEHELEERRQKLRGPVTCTTTDMFGIDWNLYENSQIWFVTSVDHKPGFRKEVVKFLKSKGLEVLEEKSIFKWIEFVLPDPNKSTTLREELATLFDCGLQQDSG